MDYSGLILFLFLSPVLNAPLILVTLALAGYFVIHNNNKKSDLGKFVSSSVWKTVSQS